MELLYYLLAGVGVALLTKKNEPAIEPVIEPVVQPVVLPMPVGVTVPIVPVSVLPAIQPQPAVIVVPQPVVPVIYTQQGPVSQAPVPGIGSGILMVEDWEGTAAEIRARWGGSGGSYGGFPNEQGRASSLPMNLVTNSYSGKQSIQLNYVGTQYDIPPKGGGFATRVFPKSREIWVTFYNLMVPGFKVAGGGNGVGGSGTKALYLYMHSESTGKQHGWVPNWMWGTKNLIPGSQGTKDAFSSSRQRLEPYQSESFGQNIQSFTQKDGHWTAYECHYKLNDPGVKNGMAEMYATDITANGPTVLVTKTINREFVDTTNAGSCPADSAWFACRIYRQDGLGEMLYDKIIISTYRVGVR